MQPARVSYNFLLGVRRLSVRAARYFTPDSAWWPVREVLNHQAAKTTSGTFAAQFCGCPRLKHEREFRIAAKTKERSQRYQLYHFGNRLADVADVLLV